MYKEKEITKVYYRPSEVAKILEVSATAVRDRDKYFGFRTKRDRKGNRKYTIKQVHRHVRIHHLLRVERFTLEGAKRQIDLNGWS